MNLAKVPVVCGAMLGYFLMPLVAILLIAHAASDSEHGLADGPDAGFTSG
jgi:hypothetical protein